MKITEALVVLFLVLFCYLFLDKFLFRGELGEICFGPTCRAPPQASDGSRYP